MVEINIIDPATGDLISCYNNPTEWDGTNDPYITANITVKALGGSYFDRDIINETRQYHRSGVEANNNCIGPFSFSINHLNPGVYSVDFFDSYSEEGVSINYDSWSVNEKIVNTIGTSPIEVKANQTTHIGLVTLTIDERTN